VSAVKIPSTVQIDAVLAEDAAKRTQITNEGWVHFVLSSGELKEGKGEDQNGDAKVSRLSFTLKLAPLREEGNPRTAVHDASITHWVTTPWLGESSIEAPDADKEKQTRKTLQNMMANSLRAIFGAELVPYNPRKGDGGKYEFNGEEIDEKSIDAAKKEVGLYAQKLAIDLMNNPSKWTNPKKGCYGFVKQEKGADGNLYPKLAKIADKVPEKESLLAYEDWFKPAPVKE
jgi:hypothetical protein